MATPTEPGVPPRTAATGAWEVTRVRKALSDRYQVERILGEGGMATVFLAEDLKHRRKVAIKVMRSELSATLGADRFLREVEIAARLNHPHILPMHDSGEADGLLYYVMPYVEGESLRERIHRERQLPVDEALRLAREVAEGLAYAHAQDVIHRDMKPANVLVSGGHALVADFGIARAARAGGQALTSTGLAIGTPQYMSPEQGMGVAEVDARTDVYAVGAMLYEMLAGEPPFSGPTAQAILARSMTETPRPLTATRPGMPATVEAVIQKAMARSPADRHQTAADLVADLDRALDQVRLGATPVALRAAETPGPSALQVWGTFGVATVLVMLAVTALVRRYALPTWTLVLAAGLMAVGAGVLVITGRLEARRRSAAPVGGFGRWFTFRNAAVGGALALVLWATVATALVMAGPMPAGGGGDGIRLAVLPFDNRGDPGDAYFADGIADEVRGKLAGLGTFLVTARSSSDQYRESTRTPVEIGRELGVAYLLTATVRWAKDASGESRVQVVPELIDTRTGGVRWQQTYDAKLTDVFEVQSQIASRVAGALGVALAPNQQQRLVERPTSNLAAYDLYLKGQAEIGADPATLRRSIAYFEQAVALDSTFTEAWTALAIRRSILYNNSTPLPALAAQARDAAQRAVALDPDGPGPHRALSVYARTVEHDGKEGMRQAELALTKAPNDPVLLAEAGNAQRAVGRWDEAILNLQRARSLDPRSVRTVSALQNAYLWTRRYPEALEASEAALTLAPGDLSMTQDKAMVFLAQGDLAKARSAIRDVSPSVAQPEIVAFFANYWDMYWVLDEQQQQLLLRLTPAAFDNDASTHASVMASVQWMRGDQAAARRWAEIGLREVDRILKDNPDPQRMAFRGLMLAYLGRKSEAVADGLRAIEMTPPERDALTGPYLRHLMVRTYLAVGERDRALDLLEGLLQGPYFLSRGWIGVDPTFREVRGNPRFERMLKGS